MSTARPHPSLPRSIGAVIAGLAAIFVTHNGTDAILHATGVFPGWGQVMSDGLFGVAAAYRFVFSIGGCYLTARLAPQRPMKHALVLGAIGVVLSAIGTAASWNAGPEFGPHWYPLSLVAMSLPAAWLGGRLYERQVAG